MATVNNSARASRIHFPTEPIYAIPGTTQLHRITGEHVVPHVCHPDSYVIGIDGNCLNPIIRDNERVLIEPVLPARGEIACLHFRNRTSFVKRCNSVITRFPMNGGQVLEFAQINPPRRYGWRAQEFEQIHRVVCVKRDGEWLLVKDVLAEWISRQLASFQAVIEASTARVA